MRILILAAFTYLNLTCVSSKALQEAIWDSAGPGHYVFEDRNLRINFHSQGSHFFWRFHNKRHQRIWLDQSDLFLTIAKDPLAYSLWGAPHNEAAGTPPIEIQAGGFVALSYPVRFRSPLRPFQVSGSAEIHLFLRAHWGEQSISYKLTFPSSDFPQSGAYLFSFDMLEKPV